MNEESSLQRQAVHNKRASHKKRLLLLFLIVFLLIIVGLIGIYYLGSKPKTPTPTVPIPTIAVMISPTPASSEAQLSITPVASPEGELVRSKLRVVVLNGSGIAGSAQKYAAILTKAGYTLVTTGNADAFDYQGITIHTKSTASKYLPLLEQDIKAAVPQVKITTSSDDTIATDAEIIAGR